MNTKLPYKPDGFHSVTPYLIVSGASSALGFYQRAFGATELFRLPGPGGKLMHAEMMVGDSHVMLADEFPERQALSPKSLGGTPVSLLVYVPNVDEVFAQAVAAGATVIRPVELQFYGDKSGILADPFGHQWSVATHVEDVPPDELQRRMAAFSPQASSSAAERESTP